MPRCRPRTATQDTALLQSSLDKVTQEAQVAKAEKDAAIAQLELLKLKGGSGGGDSSKLQSELDAATKQMSQLQAQMEKEVCVIQCKGQLGR